MGLEDYSDAEIGRRIEVLDWFLGEEVTAEEESFIASKHGDPALVAEWRRNFDGVRAWRRSRRAACAGELARRRAGAASAKEEASAGLYFGAWRGFSPLG